MLEKELELGGCGLGGPKVPEFWISPDSSPPTPLARATPPPAPAAFSIPAEASWSHRPGRVSLTLRLPAVSGPKVMEPTCRGLGRSCYPNNLFYKERLQPKWALTPDKGAAGKAGPGRDGALSGVGLGAQRVGGNKAQ